MAGAVLQPGDGERRIDGRFELAVWANVRRVSGEHAGKVLVTDISRSGFNMQSRWDFAAREDFVIDLPFVAECHAKIAWHDPLVGAYGCRFREPLSDNALTQILATVDDAAIAQGSHSPEMERRGEARFEMHLPVTARRGAVIECEVAVLTSLSMSGFRMRSTQLYDLKQTIFVELGPKLNAEARIVRHNQASGEYGGRFVFALAPALIERLISGYAAMSGGGAFPAG